MPRQSHLLANVNCRKQGEVVASGAHCLHSLAFGEFEHRILVAEICENVLVGKRVPQAFAVVTRGNYVPSQRLCGLDQRDFGVPAPEYQECFAEGFHWSSNIE